MPRTKAAKAMPVGTVVVPMPRARLKGADPFTRLVVTGVTRRGTLRLARVGDDQQTWSGVRPSDVAPVET